MNARNRKTPDNDVPAYLGLKYEDTISGFVGTATCICEYLYGCRRIQLDALVEGEPKQFMFDEPALLEIVDEDARRIQPRRSQEPGGPHDRVPPRR